MTSTLEFYSGRMSVTRNGHTVFDTVAKSINLLPTARLQGSGAFAWPDLSKATAYWFLLGGSPFSTSVCDSFITIQPQSWGPGDTYLGSVPTDSNYVDIRLAVSRSAAPSSWIGGAINVDVPQGVWFQSFGGGVILESLGFFTRGFVVERIGNDMYLRQYQSVRSGVQSIPWREDNAEKNGAGGLNNGWIYSPGGDGPRTSWLMYHIQAKGPGGDINKNRTGSNACSLGDPTNYGATYSISWDITPGRRT